MNNREIAVFDWAFFDRTKPVYHFDSPGRINILGEHTDYNGGLVLPAAINAFTRFFIQADTGREVTIHSSSLGETLRISLDTIEPLPGPSWGNYFLGALHFLAEKPLTGFRLWVDSDLPIGGGLSSSASLTVGFLYLLKRLFRLKIPSLKLVKMGQRVEHEWIGVTCGIMDQYAVTFGEKDSLIMLDCATMTSRIIPGWNSQVVLAVIDSRVSRKLAEGSYNKIVEECRETLEQVNTSEGTAYRTLSEIPAGDYRLPRTFADRLKHVQSENIRVADGIAALARGDYHTFGTMMICSHCSLADQYRVSCRELNLLVNTAITMKGVFGAKLSGAGFGGVTVNLLESAVSDDFAIRIKTVYKEKTGLEAQVRFYHLVDGCSKRKLLRISSNEGQAGEKSELEAGSC